MKNNVSILCHTGLCVLNPIIILNISTICCIKHTSKYNLLNEPLVTHIINCTELFSCLYMYFLEAANIYYGV